MRRLIFVITYLLLTELAFSQAPQKMSYQVVIRNNNTLVTSSAVGIQVSILQGSISGTEVYKEIYNPNPKTNANGLATLEIGSGIPVTGSFGAIDWSAGPYFIKTEIDPQGGTNYTITGTTQLLSVPYALYSGTAENIKGGITETDPVFTNHPSYGITSTNITDWNSAFGWGNHAGLYPLLNHTHPYLPLSGGAMTNSNVVGNLNSDLLDGQHGSYYAPASVYPATGLSSGYLPYMSGTTLANSPIWTDGINMGIGNTEPRFPFDIRKSQNATTAILLRNSDPGSSAYSGIVLNTYANSWGMRMGSLAANNNDFEIVSDFLGSPIVKLSISTSGNVWMNGNFTIPNSTESTGIIYKGTDRFIHNFSAAGSDGHNTFVGINAGNFTMNIGGNVSNFSSDNTGVGYLSLSSNTMGKDNSGFGKGTLAYNTSGKWNTAIGVDVLRLNTTGYSNAALGVDALLFNNTGSENTSIGNNSLLKNINGGANVAVGNSALTSNVNGGENVAIGYQSLFSANSDNNVAVGSLSGKMVNGGNSNTFIGTSAGFNASQKLDAVNSTAIGNGAYTTANNQVVIGNSSVVNVKTSGQIETTIATGTSPFIIASTTLNTNLNADLLDGQHGSFYAPASVYPANGLTTGYLPYKSATTLNNSIIYTDGVNTGFGTNIPQARINIVGQAYLGAVPTAGIAWAPSVGDNQVSVITNRTPSINVGSVITLTGRYRSIDNGQVAFASISGLKENAANANLDGYLAFYTSKTSIGKSTEWVRLTSWGSLGIGYSTGTEISNNKLAVNGSIFTNGVITAIGGNSTNWNTVYSWGNHAGLYRPINYVPAWSEITSNPFSISSVSSNQLLKYNSTTLKWENWTPNFLTGFTETDPSFTAWNKSSGISITASQVSDFQTNVTNNLAVLANTAKNSYPTADATKLAGIAAGAEVNVNADWNATSGDAQILNKPTIPAGTNPGELQYWNGTAWVVVPAGQPGQFLQFTTSNTPAWTTVLPILTTTAISAITNNSATSGGNIASSGGGTITARGVCWSTSPNPTLSDNKTTGGTETGIFTSLMTGLTSATIYYIRAYTTNSSFTAYGNQVNFTTAP